MPRQQNALKNILTGLFEQLEDIDFEYSRGLKKELDNYDDILESLETLTKAILPNASISRLDDDEYEVLSQDREWLSLYKDFYYYDERGTLPNEVTLILARAMDDINKLI